jgi:hypothetical protein
MYCKIVVCIIFIWLSFLSKAQTNLVPNGSFEELDTCEVGWDKLAHAVPWFQPVVCYGYPGGSSDIWNSCSINSGYSVPNNQAGSQLARTGNGYAGIGVFQSLVPNMGLEYLEVRLIVPLQTAKRYQVSMFVSLAINFIYTVGSTGMSVCLSPDSVLTCNDSTIILQPQIQSSLTQPIMDTTNWVEISGEYIAKGGEQFLTIGNFYPFDSIVWDSTSLPQNPNYLNKLAYYFIDDVSVTEIDTSIGIPEPIQTSCKLYQLEAQKWVIESTSKPSKLSIYNSIGQLVYEHIPKQNKESIELSFDQGIYYWQAGVSRGKILIK